MTVEVGEGLGISPSARKACALSLGREGARFLPLPSRDRAAVPDVAHGLPPARCIRRAPSGGRPLRRRNGCADPSMAGSIPPGSWRELLHNSLLDDVLSERHAALCFSFSSSNNPSTVKWPKVCLNMAR